MKNRVLIGLVGLSGCALLTGKKPELTAAGQDVRLLVKAEPGTECEELGDISTGNDWYKDESEVKIALRNQAAELSANFATLDVLKQDGSLLGGSGRAFSCPDPDA